MIEKLTNDTDLDTMSQMYLKINELIEEINRIKKLIEPTHH
jgi:hypothetical protein